MWWDVSQGKETEIDFLNGAIVEQAELLGLQTPANKKIIELIKALHQKSAPHKIRSINANDLLTMLG